MCKRMFWYLEIQIQKKGHADKTDAVHLSKMTVEPKAIDIRNESH